jgi:hypothetical protein
VAGVSTSANVVTFKVSKGGTSVRHMRVGPNPLNSCGSGGGPPPHQSSKPVPIKHGKFTAHVHYSGGGHVFATAKVTGKFLRHGKEKGVVTTKLPSAPNCGESRKYTTHAK